MGYLFGLASAFFFALLGVIVKKVTVKGQVLKTIFCAKMITGIIQILLLFILYLQGYNFRLPLIGFFLFAFAGIISESLGSISYFSSIIRIGPSRSSAIKSSENLMIIGLAALFLGEYLNWFEILGILTIILGIIVVVKDSNQQVKTSNQDRQEVQLGILFAFVTAASFAIANTMRRSAYTYIPLPLLGSAINSLSAATGYFLFFSFTGRLKTLKMIEPSKIIYYVGAGISFSLAMLFLNFSLYYVAAPIAAVLKNTQPLMAILLSFLIIKEEEKITKELVIGALVAVIGIFLLLMG